MNGGINMRIELFKKLCANFNKEPNEDLYILWNDELFYNIEDIQKV